MSTGGVLMPTSQRKAPPPSPFAIPVRVRITFGPLFFFLLNSPFNCCRTLTTSSGWLPHTADASPIPPARKNGITENPLEGIVCFLLYLFYLFLVFWFLLN